MEFSLGGIAGDKNISWDSGEARSTWFRVKGRNLQGLEIPRPPRLLSPFFSFWYFLLLPPQRLSSALFFFRTANGSDFTAAAAAFITHRIFADNLFVQRVWRRANAPANLPKLLSYTHTHTHRDTDTLTHYKTWYNLMEIELDRKV